MTKTFNVYCDESAHLPCAHQPLMVLGAVWCDLDQSRDIAQHIREIKDKHGINQYQEIKWTKVSNARLLMYLDLIDYFFDNDALRFRALFVRHKDRLVHDRYEQDHDTWYFKMYYSMLKVIITPKDRFRIYLDIKDTRSAEKVKKLHEVLCNTIYDFDQNVIERVQNVRSHEIEQLQIADLLIGAVRFANLETGISEAKRRIVERIRRRSRYSLNRSTLLREEKFNLFFWVPEEAGTNV